MITITIMIIPLFTLDSIYSTYASGAQATDRNKNNSNQT